MKTDDLIATLALDATPTPPGAARLWLLGALGAGFVVALGAVLMTLGPRPDLGLALATGPFWMKWGLTIGTLAIALSLTLILARPEGKPGSLIWVAALPIALIALVGVAELAGTAADERMSSWLGVSALQCPIRIAAFAFPVWMALVWAMRRMAPTRLRLAGFVVGLAAGAAGATAYAVYCSEDSMSFVATWYVLGMLIPAAITALLGPRLLRW
jgi:hypothetical protein